jgi:hypothetical protein
MYEVDFAEKYHFYRPYPLYLLAVLKIAALLFWLILYP